MKSKPTEPRVATPAPADEFGVAWTASFAVLAVLLLVLIWFPLARINAHYTITMNEGINAYYEHVAGTGGKVYGHPPKYEYANYTPVYFHLVGALGALTGDVNLTGRWVALLAYFAIAVFAGLIVHGLGGSRRQGVYAGLCWLIWQCAFEPGRVGFNDMHMMGVALSLAGLYCFVRRPEQTSWLCASAILFSVSLFTKQSLFAFPAAVAFQLLVSSRRRLAIWLGAAASACFVLLLLTWAIDGKYFLDHLFLPRLYYPSDIANSMSAYLQFIQGAFVVACFWTIRKNQPSATRVLAAAFFVAHVLATYILGWAGASLNHLTEAMVATAMLASLAMPAAEPIAAGSRFPRAACALLLIVPFFLTSLIVLPQRVPSDLARYAKEVPESEAEFEYVTKFITAQPGPALCETLLLCYAAGKPEEYDSFAVDECLRTGKIPLSEILQLLESRHFRTIQIEFPANQPMQPVARVRFPGPFMRMLFTKYKLAFRTKWYAVFVPNEA